MTEEATGSGETTDSEADTASGPAVDSEAVAHVATLARVSLTDAERERFSDQFGDVLEAFESLDAVPDVEREEELANVLRPDEVRDSLDREEALANAPETEDGHFKGPRVS